MDEVSGDGSAELLRRDRIRYQNADEGALKAQREGSLTACEDRLLVSAAKTLLAQKSARLLELGARTGERSIRRPSARNSFKQT
jgi:hypothetical protein